MFWGCKVRVTREKANEPKKREMNKDKNAMTGWQLNWTSILRGS